MHWGEQHSVGHYVDFISAGRQIAVVPFSMGGKIRHYAAFRWKTD
jgi:hypothetical protein